MGLVVGLGALALARLRGRGEQLANALDVVRSNRAGDEAVMTDAVEAARQDVQEKAADELGGVDRRVAEADLPLRPTFAPLDPSGAIANAP